MHAINMSAEYILYVMHFGEISYSFRKKELSIKPVTSGSTTIGNIFHSERLMLIQTGELFLIYSKLSETEKKIPF